MTLILTHILMSGGFKSGGFNFDAKLRRQSIDIEDLFIAHIGGLDVLAKALINASHLIEDKFLESFKNEVSSMEYRRITRYTLANFH